MIGSYKAIILDPDIDSRMRLKQVTASVAVFDSVHQYNALNFAISHLELAERCDVVFISHRFPAEEAGGFVKQAREIISARDAAYVRLLPESDLNNANVALGMRDGFDGFLCEPYSVNSLVEITELAARVKRERANAREVLAMTLLVREIAGQIDIIARMKAGGAKAGLSTHTLRETCSVLKSLEGDSRSAYFEAMLRVFEEIPAPSPAKRKLYSGASRALQARQEKRMLEELRSGISSRKDPAKKAASN